VVHILAIELQRVKVGSVVLTILLGGVFDSCQAEDVITEDSSGIPFPAWLAGSSSQEDSPSSHSRRRAGFHVKCALLLSDFDQNFNVSTNFKLSNITFHENPFCCFIVGECLQTDRYMANIIGNFQLRRRLEKSRKLIWLLATLACPCCA
jgi:hypothetical protein